MYGLYFINFVASIIRQLWFSRRLFYNVKIALIHYLQIRKNNKINIKVLYNYNIVGHIILIKFL